MLMLGSWPAAFDEAWWIVGLAGICMKHEGKLDYLVELTLECWAAHE